MLASAEHLHAVRVPGMHLAGRRARYAVHIHVHIIRTRRGAGAVQLFLIFFGLLK